MATRDPQPRAPGRWRRALAFTRAHPGATVVILVLTLVVGAIGALEPLLYKLLFDRLGEGTVLEPVLLTCAGLFGAGLLKELIGGVNNWLTWRTRIGVNYELLDATVSRLHTLPIAFHKSESVGAVMTRLQRGVQGFVDAFAEIAFQVLPALVYLATAIVVMVRLEWRLALLVLAFAPLPALIAAWAAPEQTARERSLLERWSRIFGRFNEVLHGIVTVKSFAMEEEERTRFLTDVHAADRVVVRGVARDTLTGGARNLAVVIATAAAMTTGAWMAVRGDVTVGTVVAFMGYVAGLFGPVQGLTGIYQTVRKASVALDTIFEIIDQEDQLGDAPDAVDPGPLRGDVRLRGVCFAYEPDQPILSDIDLHVRPGEVIALVGPSGCGKSTLAGLIKRLHDPTAGVVEIDGIDLRRLKQRALRQQIGVVLQDAMLFNDTVRANIAYGRPHASHGQIVAAARAANAHEFIEALPRGYDTVVGERGNLLSTGQRQRIAIARALVKDPAILILDEPTSALDAESELLVQQALRTLVRGRTTFIIAHRLSTVVDADRIVVLRDGRIIEQGRHRDLVAADGFYARLVRHQTNGLMLIDAA